VLAVDDDGDNLDVVVETLFVEGFAACGVSSVREALLLLQEGPPPCAILCDLMMPDLNGEDMLRHLRADPALRHVPFMLITAQTPLKLPRDLDVPVLYKPFDGDQLLAFVKMHCQPASSPDA
jgi:CheY-like chemotaxis protein